MNNKHVKILIAAVVAGLVLFVWGFVSWTILSWRDGDVHKFSDEAAVMQVMLDNAPASGIYYIPGDEADYSPTTPNTFVNLMKDGFQTDMGGMMITGIISNILMSVLLAYLLLMASGLSYAQRLAFVTTAGLLMGLAGNLPYWNWFGFPSGYTLVQIIDSVVMWFLAGLVLAKLVPERQ